MSNFICEKCDVSNIDSGKLGYTEGCIHYPPEYTGIFECVVERENLPNLNQRIRYDHAKQKWFLSDYGKIKSWKVNPHL